MSFDKGCVEQAIIDAMSTAVLMFDCDLKLIRMNPSAEDLLGISMNQNLGLELRQLWFDPNPYIIAAQAALTGNYALTERNMRLAVSSKRILQVDGTFTPLQDLDETRLSPGLLIELLRLDRSMQIAKETQLITQNETARAIVRGLAHEIRNPLGGLRGAAQLLEREIEDATLREYTQIIVGEADRLQNLLERMLGPRGLPDKRSVNVHEVIERVCSLVQAQASPGIVVERDYDPSLPEVVVDRDQLIQAILNIARNAVIALNHTGIIRFRTRIQRNITLNSQLHRLVVRIEVEDNGPGVAPELMENLFYPMITGRPDGTGLGLSIAQSLIRQHGGLIECTSRPGQTLFSLLLPLE